MADVSSDTAISAASGGFMYLATEGGDVSITTTKFDSDSAQATAGNGGVFYVNTDSDSDNDGGACTYTGTGDQTITAAQAGADGGVFYLSCKNDVTVDLDGAGTLVLNGMTAGDQGGFIYSTGDDFTFLLKNAAVTACAAGGDGGFIHTENTGTGTFTLTSATTHNVNTCTSGGNGGFINAANINKIDFDV